MHITDLNFEVLEKHTALDGRSLCRIDLARRRMSSLRISLLAFGLDISNQERHAEERESRSTIV